MKKQEIPEKHIEKTLAGYARVILDVIVTIYMLLIIVVMPFYFQEGYNHIGSDKSYFFRTYTSDAAKIFLAVLAVYLLCLLVNWFRDKKWPLELTFRITDIFALGYALCVGISYLCSDYKETALWGTAGWYMGMVPQLMLVGIYFAISRFWRRKDWMFYLFLPVSAALFLLGYLNRFDIWPIPMENSGMPMFISTIGNINWYCGYMVCVLFLGIGMFWMEQSEKKWKTFFLALYCFIGFLAIITQGSDSGLFALAAVMVLLFVQSVREIEENPYRMQRFWQMLLLFAGASILTFVIRRKWPVNFITTGIDILTNTLLFSVLLAAGALLLLFLYRREKDERQEKRMIRYYRIAGRAICILIPFSGFVLVSMIVCNTMKPGSLGIFSDKAIFSFNESWGSGRGATWTSGWRCFAAQDLLHKLVGVGPDCMSDYIYSGENEELLQATEQIFGGNRLTNAHGEWLTVLVNTGIAGMAAFTGMIISAIVPAMKRGEKDAAFRICGICVFAYTANNFWSFQQSMSVATIFVIMGMGRSHRGGGS